MKQAHEIVGILEAKLRLRDGNKENVIVGNTIVELLFGRATTVEVFRSFTQETALHFATGFLDCRLNCIIGVVTETLINYPAAVKRFGARSAHSREFL